MKSVIDVMEGLKKPQTLAWPLCKSSAQQTGGTFSKMIIPNLPSLPYCITLEMPGKRNDSQITFFFPARKLVQTSDVIDNWKG